MLLSLQGNDHPSAILALADGTVFSGQSIGATTVSVGEVVFNTSMTGYQEILTDPSYCRQIVTLTYPHIGSYGINPEDSESDRVHATGLVIRDLPLRPSNFRATQTLSDFLRANGTAAIAGIDTRRLTRLLRSGGAQNGCILALPAGQPITPLAVEQARQAARDTPSMSGLDLAKVVSTTERYGWTDTEWRLGTGFGRQSDAQLHVVAYDFGVKRNSLRMLAERGCRITVVPAQTRARDALALDADGIYLSNGPGDPQPCDYAIAAVRELVDAGIPVFGICLGHQLLSLASGAVTFKMKFGHRGANHPVKDLDTGKVGITSQNHGFAVDAHSLPANLRATHVSLFDGTLQGVERTDRPAFGFQGHPEGAPGPHDVGGLFDRFVASMRQHRENKQRAPSGAAPR